MAKVIAICTCKTCGNEFKHTAFRRNTTEANSYKIWAEENIDECPDCYKARIEKEKELASDVAAAEAKELGLPELNGSPKQIAWAETLRANVFENLIKAEERTKTHPTASQEDRDKAFEMIKALRVWLRTKNESKFWIDNREKGIKSLFSLCESENC